MIQSMEILQLPMLALQERIEQELNSNPVLEVEEEEATAGEAGPSEQQVREDAGEKEAESAGRGWQAESLERERPDDNFREYMERGEYFRPAIRDDEPDRKLEAIKNTAAPPQSLHEHLADQWRMVEADERVKKAGGLIIDYID
jgi:RNA polymerase sigma-54 factor